MFRLPSTAAHLGEIFTWLIDSCGILPMGLRRASTAASERLKRIYFKDVENRGRANSSSSSSSSSTSDSEDDADNQGNEGKGLHRKSSNQNTKSPFLPLPEPLPLSELQDLPTLGNTMAYVYTNPAADAVLRPADAVYALAQDVPDVLFRGPWAPGTHIPQRVCPLQKRKSSPRSSTSMSYHPGTPKDDDPVAPKGKVAPQLAKVREETRGRRYCFTVEGSLASRSFPDSFLSAYPR